MNRFLLSSLLIRFALGFAVLGLAACQTPATDPADADATPTAAVSDTGADPAVIRAEIEAMTASFQAAARAADADAIAAFYADAAVLHPANAPAVRGRAALDASAAAVFEEPSEITFNPTDVVASEAGDMAYEVGAFVGGVETGEPGKYLTLWRRTPDGWKIAAVAWSLDVPPPAGAN